MLRRAGSDANQQLSLVRPRNLTDVPRTYATFAQSWTPIILLVLAVAALRIIYLAFLSPYALVEDEAHYWEWSRHLDWSYYSKGPGVALIISASTAIFGDTAFAVRLPAVLSSILCTLAIAGLAADALNDKRAGFIAALCVLFAPIFQMSAILMTIDGPYVACWAAAAWAAWRALAKQSKTAWLALGLALAIGFIFKYTILLLPPGILLFAFLARKDLNIHRNWQRYAALGSTIAILGTLPIIIWNAQHDWVTVRHLLGHIDMPGGDVVVKQTTFLRWNPMWTIELIGTQIAMIGPALFLCLYSGLEAFRQRKTDQPAWQPRLFLIALSLPILLFYGAVTLFNPAEGNWPMAGFVTLLALCGWGATDAMDRLRDFTIKWLEFPKGARPRWGIFRKRPQLHRHLAWHATIAFGLIAGATLFRLDWAVPVVDGLATSASRIAGRVGIGDGEDKKIVPMGRITSAIPLAAEVDEFLAQLAIQTNKQPFVIAQHYGRASQLAFYLDNHPTVYCSSSLMDGRQTQYDLWAQTDLAQDDLKGRPAVLLGGSQPQWSHVFNRVQPIGVLKADHKRDRQAFLGFGYRGFAPENKR